MTDQDRITDGMLCVHLNRLEGQANAARHSLRTLRKSEAAKAVDGELLIIVELMDEVYEELAILAQRVKLRLSSNDN